MSVNVFGLTHETVRSDELSFLDPFSTASNPTSTRIAVFIDQAGAKLQGKLAIEGISAADIDDTASAPYLSCQEVLTKMVAARILRVMTGQYPEVLKRLQEEIDAWFKDLDEGGATALGDATLASSSDSPPEGPTTHISELDLDIGDPDDASDVVPELRRSDLL